MRKKLWVGVAALAWPLVEGASPAAAHDLYGERSIGSGLYRTGNFDLQHHTHYPYDAIYADIRIGTNVITGSHFPLGCGDYQSKIDRFNNDNQLATEVFSPFHTGHSTACYFSAEYNDHYGTGFSHNHYFGDNKFGAYWRDDNLDSNGDWIKLPGPGPEGAYHY